MHMKTTVPYFKTSLAAYKFLMTLDRFLDENLSLMIFVKLILLATIMSAQGFLYFVLNPCNATTLSHLDTW